MLTETEWAELRQRLCAQFSEDVVQTVILRLHKHFLKGRTVPSGEAIYWCRKVAYRTKLYQRRSDAQRAEATMDLPSHTDPEQEGIFLEEEIYARLNKPKPLSKTGRPIKPGAVRMRRTRAKQRLAAA